MLEKAGRLLSKGGWRKLSAFAVSTALLIAGTIDQGIWLSVALAFIGVQGLADILVARASKEG